MKRVSISLLCFFLLSLGGARAQRTVGSIETPAGFSRVEAKGYGEYLRSLPLKPEGSKVMLYNGRPKPWQDMEIGTSDLQQCADAVMRLRAEYLWNNKRYADIHFNFTNGFRADYSKWAEGYRISVTGNKVSWYKATGADYGYRTFRKYLNVVFSYAGTASLAKELSKVTLADAQIGDVFIVGGHPGHAMTIVDMAADSRGRRAILVAQSYMPAQDIHIVTNLDDRRNSPWYIFDGSVRSFEFPEWSFSADQIKRF